MNPRIVLLQTTDIADSDQYLRKNDIKRSLIAEVWTDQDIEVAMFLIPQVGTPEKAFRLSRRE